MNEASKTLLVNTVKEWNKFVAEREKLTGVANEIAAQARKCISESIIFLKAQNVEAQGEDISTMHILNVPVTVEPIIETTFPVVKGSVLLKCGGATRMIIINPNLSISAGGTPFMFEQFKKGIPETFMTNAADFVRDAFLNAARTGGKE
ncbi:MAG: hypothetical protein V1799_03150 [bacterium]